MNENISISNNSTKDMKEKVTNEPMASSETSNNKDNPILTQGTNNASKMVTNALLLFETLIGDIEELSETNSFVVDIESVEKKQISKQVEYLNYVFHIAVIHFSGLYFVFTATFIIMFKMYMFPGQRRIETRASTV